MRSVKAKSEAGILVFVVFALGVLVGGVGYRLWAKRLAALNGVPGGGGTARGQRLPGQGPFARLGLTADQQKQLGTIMDDMHTQLQAVYGPADAKGDEIRSETRATIRAILTPEQQTKFDAMMKERDSRPHPGPGRPGPRFGPGGPRDSNTPNGSGSARGQSSGSPAPPGPGF